MNWSYRIIRYGPDSYGLGEVFGETVFRLIRTGHLHKSRQTRYVAGDSFTGVELRVLRSLSASDSWHTLKGYVKERRAVEAFIHDLHDGQVAAFVSKLPEGL